MEIIETQSSQDNYTPESKNYKTFLSKPLDPPRVKFSKTSPLKTTTSSQNKNRSMGPVLIWSNITIVENAVFQETLALTKLQHTASSKRVIVQKEN